MTSRPSPHCKEVLEAVAKILAPRVWEWTGEPDDEENNDNLIGVATDLVIAMEHTHGDVLDGYKLASEMERRGYDPDGMLVHILDEASILALREHDKLVERWVLMEGIRPEFGIGSKVRNSTCVSSTGTIFRRKFSGEIVAVKEKQAKYTVFCENEGHVRVGEGTHGFLVGYEDVVAEE